ncbi:MAG: hypothetical protein GXP29_03660 [Planctomycetes bacterium]|nr:hypothetical protein [Planctomycetota bacterium]
MPTISFDGGFVAMFQTGILAHLWNVVDLGIEPSLDLIQSVGAQSISLVVTSSRVSQLRAGEIDGPRIFRSDGGYFFQPDKSLYGNTRIKPVVASELNKRDPLEQIAESCKKRDLELRLRITALEQPVIASRHPGAATKTVLGDVSPETLSASNPDVVELLRATATDLSKRYAPAAIELDGLCFHSGAFNENDEDVGLGLYFNGDFMSLLALSFDESSAQSAITNGVDVDAVSRYVRVTLENVLHGGQPLDEPLSDLMNTTPALRAYINSQVDNVTALVTQVAGAIACPVSIVLTGEGLFGVYPRGDCDAISHDRGVIIESLVGWEEDLDSENFHGIEGLQPSLIARQILLADVSVCTPECLISDVKHYADEGFGGVVLSAYGLIPPVGFQTIKKAFRFASRSAH